MICASLSSSTAITRVSKREKPGGHSCILLTNVKQEIAMAIESMSIVISHKKQLEVRLLWLYEGTKNEVILTDPVIRSFKCNKMVAARIHGGDAKL